jgi:hypothetical protein
MASASPSMLPGGLSRPSMASEALGLLPGDARRISARAAWPQMTATRAPTNGIPTQQTTPNARLTIAVVLIVLAGWFIGSVASPMVTIRTRT